MNDESRPSDAESAPETTATKSGNETTRRNLDIETAAALRRRRAAAWRLPPFDAAGHRDEFDILADEVRDIVPWLPWGLTEDVRRRHANDLLTRGWTVDEVVAVLKVQPRAVA